MSTPGTAIPPTLPSPAQDSDRLLAILCHCSLFFGLGFVLPLIIFLVKRSESGFVAIHSKEVLNFHISLLIYVILLIPLCFILIGIPLYIALAVMAFICSIIAAIKAAEGGYYRYPMTIRFIS